MHTLNFTRFFVDDDGFDCEEIVSVPAKWEFCGNCRGDGKHVNRNIDGNGITASEWENDWDEEEREAYFRGDYDVTCDECDGSGKVLAFDFDRIDPSLKKEIDEREIENARALAEESYLRRVGY